MSEMEKLADCPFCQNLGVVALRQPDFNWRVVCPNYANCGALGPKAGTERLARAAWNTRQHATALEIGRGIGREEAAKVCEVSSDAAVEEAATSLASGDTKGRLTMITHHLCAQGLAAAIRSTSPALDVEGMVMLAIKADMARQLSGKPLPGPQHDSTDWSAEGDFQSLDLTEIACAVLASLGIKNG